MRVQSTSPSPWVPNCRNSWRCSRSMSWLWSSPRKACSWASQWGGGWIVFGQLVRKYLRKCWTKSNKSIFGISSSSGSAAKQGATDLRPSRSIMFVAHFLLKHCRLFWGKLLEYYCLCSSCRVAPEREWSCLFILSFGFLSFALR